MAEYKNVDSSNYKCHINPTGKFIIGGPQGDSGLTGRKIIVDTYGGYARHGGGSFSGKDPTKVDRSATYMARYVAKNIVASGLATKCEVQFAYAIGEAEPVSVMVDTYGTGKVSEEKIVKLVRTHFDLTPKGIINKLDLRRPIYRQTAAYGHFGRLDLDLPWEKTDKAKLYLKIHKKTDLNVGFFKNPGQTRKKVEDLVTIEGMVDEIIYTNEINGYTVCGIKCEDSECTAVGYMPFITEGELIKLVGQWTTHPDYGKQLKVSAYEKILPKTCDSIERYLASGVIKGLGPVTALRIIEKFGEDSLDVIHDTPERLADIKGISFSKALKIGEDFERQSGLRNVVLFFQEMASVLPIQQKYSKHSERKQ